MLFFFAVDIAVGAPYDGDEDGIGGIVYIYHGHSDGLSKTPDQVNYLNHTVYIIYNLKTNFTEILDHKRNELWPKNIRVFDFRWAGFRWK